MKTIATLAILASIVIMGCADNPSNGGGGYSYNPYAMQMLNNAFSNNNQPTRSQPRTMHDYDYIFNNPNPVPTPTRTNCHQMGYGLNASISCSSY